jgi:exosome complex component RRP42
MSSMDISNLTKAALKRMLSEGKRFDGRGPFDLNNFEVEYNVSNKAEGSARVRLGKTEVVVGVKMDVGTPYPDSPDKGNLIISGDLLPLASPRYEMGPPKFDAIELPRLIDRMVRESGMIDFKGLCITPGEKVWNMYIDIYPINDDGSVIDAASIACVAALHNARMPGIDENGRADYHNRTDKRLPLSEETLPISFTFYKLDDSLILHPTREEEEACDAKIILGISKWGGQHMINSCQKGRETPLNREEIVKIAEILPKKYEEAIKRLNGFLK